MGAFQRTDKENFSADMDRVFELFPRLHERRSQKAGTMSGGEQQMCAIGRALMARPKLLLLDEPSMGLAPIFVDRIFETIVEVNKEGTPVLLVEQNALMALDVANARYVMETGRIALEGPALRAARRTSSVRKTLSRAKARPPHHASGAYGGASSTPTRARPPRDAVRHLERARDRVARDEPEGPRRDRVSAPGDDHASEPTAPGRSRPVRVRAAADGRSARPVGGDRTRVGRGCALRLGAAEIPVSSAPGDAGTGPRPCENERVSTGRGRASRRRGRGTRRARAGARSPSDDRRRGDRVERLPGYVRPDPRDAHASASSGSSSRAARSSTARRSASACATEGVPAKTAVAAIALA